MSDPLIRSRPDQLLRAALERLQGGFLPRVLLPLVLTLLAAHSGALAYRLAEPAGPWLQLALPAWWLPTALTLVLALTTWLNARSLGLPASHQRAALFRGLLATGLASLAYALLAATLALGLTLWLPQLVLGIAAYAAERAMDPLTTVPGLELTTGLLLYGTLHMLTGTWLNQPMFMLLVRARPSHVLRRARRALYGAGWLEALFAGPLLLVLLLAAFDFRLALLSLPLMILWPALASQAVAESAGNPFQALSRAQSNPREER